MEKIIFIGKEKRRLRQNRKKLVREGKKERERMRREGEKRLKEIIQ